jgi:hypothetical protein
MTKSTILLIVILVAMACAYVYYFTDLFQPATIQILAQVRPSRGTPQGAPGYVSTYPVSFAFDNKLGLTEVKVVSVDDEKTNKYPHAVWHMISDSNSIPVQALLYGQWLKGMKSKVPHARPDPLQPDVKYRLYVRAGKFKGKVDFKTVAVPGQ